MMQNQKSIRMASAATLALAAAFLPQLAHAQDSAVDDAEGEIVVTASKRGAQTLQNLPMAVQALGGEDLADQGISAFGDYANQISGLSFEDQGPGDKKYVIRGIQSVGAATTGVYFDELVLTGANNQDGGGRQPDIKLVDMERLEVLKGPQGTLYGASSMSGTVRMITNKPDSDETSGGVSAGIAGVNGASSATHNIDGYVNVPLIEGKLAARAVGYYSYDAGWIDNDFSGIEGVNDQKISGGRLALRWTPSDLVTVDAMMLRQTTSSRGASYYQPVFGTNKQNTLNPVPWRDDIEAYTGAIEIQALSGSFTLSGGHAVRSILYYQDSTRKLCSLLDAPANSAAGCKTEIVTPTLLNRLSTLRQPVRRAMTNVEFRYGSDWSGPVQFVGGLYYENTKTNFLSQIMPITIDGQELPDTRRMFVNRRVDGSVKQIAGFGELSYEIAPSLTATVGARTFRFDINQTGQNLVTSSRPVAAAPVITASTENGTTFKASVSYKPTSSLHLYATYSEGFRAGGTNEPDLVSGIIFPPYGSDSLANYEVGIKGSMLDRAVTFDLSAYFLDWQDMQVKILSQTGRSNFLSNVGSAHVKGIEASLAFHPTQAFEFGGNFTLLRARLAEDDPATISGRVRALKGDRIPNVPEFTGYVYAQWEAPLSDSISGKLRAEYSYTGASYTDFRPASVTYRTQGDYGTFNLRYSAEIGSVTVGFYAENLFNSKGVQSFILDTARPDSLVPVRPTTFGVDVGVKF